MNLTRSQINQLRKIRRFNNWLNQYDMVELFYQKYGRFPKSKERFPGTNPLGRWYKDTNREAYRRGRMKLWQVQLLTKFDYVFEAPDHWEANYDELKKAWKQHPESWPYVYYRTPNLKKLEIWCKRQRTFYAENKLPTDKINKLNSIRFTWEQPGEVCWNRNYNNLVKWALERSNIPRRYSANRNERFLSIWLAKERSKINTGILSTERKNRILSICKKYRYNPYRPKWNESYELLNKWYRTHNNRPNKRSPNIGERRLGSWIIAQTIRHRQGRLSKEESRKFELLKHKIFKREKAV